MAEAPDLVSMADIARLAGQSRSTVGNWKRRYAETFPHERERGTRGPLYDRADVLGWLQAEGKRAAPEDDEAALVWRMRESLGDSVTGDDAVHLILELMAMRADSNQESWNRLQHASRNEVVATFHSEVGARHPFSWRLFRADWPTREPLTAVISNLSEVVPQKLGAVADSLFDSMADAGPASGERVMPPQLVQLAVALAQPTGTIYNPVCGFGQVLAAAHHAGNGAVTAMFGQEMNTQILAMGQMNLALHNVHADLAPGDPLAEDAYPDLRADRVIAFPPWGQRIRGKGALRDDPRWMWGEPSPNDGNAAWIQHCLYHLAERGRAVIAQPPSAMFEGGRAGRIRQRIIKSGLLEAVIALPPGLFSATNLESCLLVFAKGRPSIGGKPAPVLMIELAENDAPRTSRRAKLTPEQIQTVVHLVGKWRNGHPPSGSLAAVATYDALAANDFVLDPGRYIALPQITHDADELRERRNALLVDLAAATETAREADGQLVATAEVPRVTTPQTARLADLAHSESITRGFPTSRARKKEGIPILSVADLRNGKPPRHFADREDCTDLAIEPARTGDVLISIEGGTVGEVLVVPEGHVEFVPSQQVATLRVQESSRIDPWYLAAWLSTEVGAGQLRRLARGGGIQRIAVKDLATLAIPIPPPAVQHQIAQRLSAFEHAQAAHAAVTACIEALRDLDLAIAFNDATQTTDHVAPGRTETPNDGS